MTTTDTDIYVRIDGPAFDQLVRGKEVFVTARQGGQLVRVRMILSDIGWGRMLKSIDNAMNGDDPHAG